MSNQPAPQPPAASLQAPYGSREAKRPIWQGTVPILENVRLAQGTWRLRLPCPPIARRILPGQFVMLRLAGFDDPLLGRAFALYDTVLDASGRQAALDIVYYVAGKLTGRLVKCLPGQEIDLWGPLGNGFAPRPTRRLVMVAGGIGQTPLLALAQEALGMRAYGDPPRAAPRASEVILCYGTRRADLLAGVADFQRLGVRVLLSTDDGSAGRRGLVTSLVEQVLGEADTRSATRIVCCGPEPMMQAVARLAQRADVPCELSLETPMACGLGICFTCVARIRGPDGQVDYRRTCLEGPVFDARQVVF